MVFTKEELNFEDKEVKKGVYFYTLNEEKEIILRLEATKVKDLGDWYVTKRTFDINYLKRSGSKAYETNVPEDVIEAIVQLELCDPYASIHPACDRAEISFINEVWDSLIDHYIYARVCVGHGSVERAHLELGYERFLNDIPKDSVLLTESDLEQLYVLGCFRGDFIWIDKGHVQAYKDGTMLEELRKTLILDNKDLSPRVKKLFEKPQEIYNFVVEKPVYKTSEEASLI